MLSAFQMLNAYSFAVCLSHPLADASFSAGTKKKSWISCSQSSKAKRAAVPFRLHTNSDGPSITRNSPRLLQHPRRLISCVMPRRGEATAAMLAVTLCKQHGGVSSALCYRRLLSVTPAEEETAIHCVTWDGRPECNPSEKIQAVAASENQWKTCSTTTVRLTGLLLQSRRLVGDEGCLMETEPTTRSLPIPGWSSASKYKCKGTSFCQHRQPTFSRRRVDQLRCPRANAWH